jgi:hypothetical protein
MARRDDDRRRDDRDDRGDKDGREEELERYRQAAEDALQQLDWCIGYLHGIRKLDVSRALARNRSYIRSRLMKREEEPLPAQQTEQT